MPEFVRVAVDIRMCQAGVIQRKSDIFFGRWQGQGSVDVLQDAAQAAFGLRDVCVVRLCPGYLQDFVDQIQELSA